MAAVNPKTKTRAIKAAESFAITFLAVFAADSSGIFTAPDRSAAIAAAWAIIPAALTAAYRAATAA